MFAPRRYALLLESLPWVDSPTLQEAILQTTRRTFSWPVREEGVPGKNIHDSACYQLHGYNHHFQELTLQEAWEELCPECHRSVSELFQVHQILPQAQADLLELIVDAAWMVGNKEASLWVKERLDADLLIRAARSQNLYTHAPRLMEALCQWREDAQAQAEVAPVESFADYAALHATNVEFARKTSGVLRTLHPQIMGTAWDRASDHWRNSRADPRRAPGEGLMGAQDVHVFELAQATLDQTFETLRDTTVLHLYAVQVHAWQQGDNLYHTLLQKCGETHEDRIYVRIPVVVGELLHDLGWHVSDLGEIHPAETPEVLETARCLYRDSFQVDKGEGILAAARMLNV